MQKMATASTSTDGAVTVASTSLLSAITSPAYSTAVYLARQACLSLFSRLDSGQASGLIEIHEKSKPDSPIVYGAPVSKRAWRLRQEKQEQEGQVCEEAPASSYDKSPHARLDVKNDAFWIRLVLGNDLGFAEAYMSGEVSTPDLGACFKVRVEEDALLSCLVLSCLSLALHPSDVSLSPSRSSSSTIVTYFPTCPWARSPR